MQTDTRRYLTVLATLLVCTALVQVARAKRGVEAVYRPDFSRVPMVVGKLKGTPQPVAESIYSYLQANAMEERLYTDGQREVRLVMIYGTDWRSIHAPTGCFPAQGWQIVHNRTVDPPAPPGCPHPGPLHARVLDTHKGDAHLLAMFAYARPGGTTSDWTTHVLKVATGPRGAGGMIIILQTPIQGNDAQAAEALLSETLCSIYPSAVEFWYTGNGPQPGK
jgi:hypothetical protein